MMKKMVTFVINDKVVQTHIVCVCVRVRVCVLGREGASECASDCCLMPTQQFSTISWQEQVNFQ